MKLSRFWIYLVLILFVLGLWTWYWAKTYLKQETPIPTPKPVVTTTEEEDTVETTTDTLPVNETKEDKTEIVEEDSKTIENTDKTDIKKVEKKTDDKNVWTSKYSYILIAWLSASLNLQNTLVWLYNTELKTVTYLPYDYYIEKYWDKTDVSIWNMTIDEIRDYLTSQGIKITDQVSIDQDIIFDLFTSTMSWDEYVITYLDEKWEKVEMPIKTKAHLYNLISKDNLNQYKNLEQLHNTILDLLIKNNLTISKVFKDTKGITLNQETLYKKWDFLSITDKLFEKKQINWKFFSVDKEHKYLKELITWDLSNYAKILEAQKTITKAEEKVVTTEEVKPKETLQQKLERLKKEKEAIVTPTQEVKTESLADKLKRLREQNQ